MNIESVAKPSPEFDFTGYFLGHTKASGWFSDRFGNVRKHFTGDFVGSVDGDYFTLEETLDYSDGLKDHRVWRVSIDSEGLFHATSDSLVGGATGRLLGNTLNLAYQMKVDVANNKQWLLTMDDWMFYQPDGSLHNITKVKKWGIQIGTVSTQYTKLNKVSANDDEGTDAKLINLPDYAAGKR